MASSKRLPLIVVLVLAALAAALPAASAQQQQQPECCRDSLAELMECEDYMNGGATASPSCCAAYDAAFNANPLCLCYVADGTFARATGKNVDVTRALQIPVSCGQFAPPIEICNMQGLVLPPYEPVGAPAVASAAAPEPASAPAMQPPPSASGGSSVAPSFTTAPPPPSTSDADPFRAPMILIIAAAIVVILA